MPFAEEMVATPLLLGFKELIDMEGYDGTIDPQDHLNIFRYRMYLLKATNATKYRVFPTTLQKWH